MSPPIHCFSCHTGTLVPVEREKVFTPPGLPPVVVRMQACRCSHCKLETVLEPQYAENLARLAARAKAYGAYLPGEVLHAMRRRHGLSLPAAAKLFGLSPVTLSRYENEVAYPPLAVNKLLRLANANPVVIKTLADIEGIALTPTLVPR